MGRTLSIAAIALLLSACSAPVYQHSLTAEPTVDDPFTTARQQLIDMDYAIEDADRESGLLRAERTTSTGMMDLGRRTDRITVSIGAESVQVTAESDWGSYGEEEERSQVSDEAMEDAEALRRALQEGR